MSKQKEVVVFREIRVGEYVLRFWPSDNGWMCGITSGMMQALTEQPAQQQEPEYAWPTVADYERDVGFQTNEAFRIAWNMARTTNRMLGHTSSQPAQRTWVELTEEEMIDLQDRCGISIHQSDFQTIEAKLKEKNNG